MAGLRHCGALSSACDTSIQLLMREEPVTTGAGAALSLAAKCCRSHGLSLTSGLPRAASLYLSSTHVFSYICMLQSGMRCTYVGMAEYNRMRST